MRSRRAPKAHAKTMLSAKYLEDNEGSNGSAQIPCGSPISEVRGLNNLKLSRDYPRGAVLFLEGQQARGVYLLRTGRAKVSICSADGKKLIMRIAGPGDALGLYAGLTGRSFEATAEMLENGRVDFMPRQDLLDLIARQQSFGLHLIQIFSQQFSEFIEHSRLMLSGSAIEKLAQLIWRWSLDFGERTTEGTSLRILLTQEEIAQIIGASRETVTRLLSVLKRDQIIRVNRGAMLIQNRAALASLAQRSS